MIGVIACPEMDYPISPYMMIVRKKNIMRTAIEEACHMMVVGGAEAIFVKAGGDELLAGFLLEESEEWGVPIYMANDSRDLIYIVWQIMDCIGANKHIVCMHANGSMENADPIGMAKREADNKECIIHMEGPVSASVNYAPSTNSLHTMTKEAVQKSIIVVKPEAKEAIGDYFLRTGKPGGFHTAINDIVRRGKRITYIARASNEWTMG